MFHQIYWIVAEFRCKVRRKYFKCVKNLMKVLISKVYTEKTNSLKSRKNRDIENVYLLSFENLVSYNLK